MRILYAGNDATSAAVSNQGAGGRGANGGAFEATDDNSGAEA